MSVQRAPGGLGAAGKALWRQIIAGVAAGAELDARELLLLEQAARAADRLQALEGVLDRDGLMIRGSKGQDRLHPGVCEARMQRQLIAVLLSKVELAPVPERTGRLSARQRNQLRDARRRADTRWPVVQGGA